MDTKRQLTGRSAPPRLRCFDYRGPYRYFLTICTFNKYAVFTGDWPYEHMVTLLSRAAGKFGFDVIAYCFMPDHLHLLVEGAEDSDLIKFVGTFKQTTAFYYHRLTGKRLWQRSFYDRILRRDEDAVKVAAYILHNPVRKGLARDPVAWPYAGSFVCPLPALLLTFGGNQ